MILDHRDRIKILVDSLRFCQKYKQLRIFAWVIMPNHLHLVVQNQDVGGFVRDFKKHTAFELMQHLKATNPKLTKNFLLPSGKYQIWEKTNMPKLIESESFFHQKCAYIEANPVRKGLVEYPEKWLYSSASPEALLSLDSVTQL